MSTLRSLKMLQDVVLHASHMSNSLCFINQLGHCRSNGKVQLKDISDEQLEAALPKGTDVLWLQGGLQHAQLQPVDFEGWRNTFLGSVITVDGFLLIMLEKMINFQRRIMVGCPRHIHAFYVCFYLGTF